MEDKNFAERLNILRAGVLGANDGIISIAGVVIGVASATSNIWFILISALSAILPVPFRWPVANMSVSQRKKIPKKLPSLRNKLSWIAHLKQLERVCTQTFLSQGDCETAAEVKVNQAFSKNPIKVLVEEKYGVDLDEITNPWHAAVSSFFAFRLVPCHQH